MAHDYAATSLSDSEMTSGFTTTPLTPIYSIYYALKAITDPTAGVEDKSKIALAVSFGSVEWTLQDGKVIQSKAGRPTPPEIYDIIMDNSTTMNYSVKYQNPYITYHNVSNNTDNIIWYEDERSINAKVELARMFGINGISIWRLGLIPNYSSTSGREIYYDVLNDLLA
jgi:spore germination protein YaaH